MDEITDLVNKIYSNYDNFEEEIIHENGKKCYIFFSSNGLYKESDATKISHELIEKDRYEWKSIAQSIKYHKDLGKIIYVRDVKLLFYLDGINKTVSNIDEVINKLRKMTEHYEVTTVGISSGGYMAVITAIQLNAVRAITISGQFDLKNRLPNEFLSENASDIMKQKYYNIVQLVKENRKVPIYYLCPFNCEHDRMNYNLIQEEENVRVFLFPDSLHAATIYPFNFPDFIYMSNNSLDKLKRKFSGKMINKNLFFALTVSIRGLCSFISRSYKNFFNIIELRKKWEV